MQNSTFSKRLAEAMSIREMTQTDLHERTGINKSSISTYLRGDYKAKQDKVDLLSTALNVSPAWLMGYDVPMVPGTKSEERNYDISSLKNKSGILILHLLRPRVPELVMHDLRCNILYHSFSFPS